MNNRVGKLKSQTVPAGKLTSADRERMWEIFCTYYTDVSKEMFETDMLSKSHVILVRDIADNSVQGFSTLQIIRENVLGKKVVAIFSGDTIVETAYWGQTALQRAFFRYILKVKAQHPFCNVYWFLISKGYKTYLLLSRNFVEHWPRYNTETPKWQRAVIDSLSKNKFGNAWNSEKGVLKFETCVGRLKAGVAGIEESAMQYPDIKFFAEKNPNHMLGDELCCIGRVNLTLAVYYPFKLIRKNLMKLNPKSKPLNKVNRWQ